MTYDADGIETFPPEWGDDPVDVEFESLSRILTVRHGGDSVKFFDGAPLFDDEGALYGFLQAVEVDLGTFPLRTVERDLLSCVVIS
jgi:hypothetical protein